MLLVLLAAQQLPSVGTHCVATRSNARVLVDMKVEGLIGAEVERLIKLGLPGTVEVETRVLRRNAMWFDSEIAATRQQLQLSFEPLGERWTLGGRTQRSASSLALPRIVAASRTEPAQYRVEVQVSISVVTTESLGSTVKWVNEASAVPDVVLEAVARSLVLNATASCTVSELHDAGS